MQIVGFIFGIISIIGMLIGFIPCLGALNWINIPIAGLGLIFSVIGYANVPPGEPNQKAKVGIILCGIALVFGSVRLLLGAGIV